MKVLKFPTKEELLAKQELKNLSQIDQPEDLSAPEVRKPQFKKPDGDFNDRMQKIKNSLEKINQLMRDLKGPKKTEHED